MSEPRPTPAPLDDTESPREMEERLLSMSEDGGETWDLSRNDQAACLAGSKAMKVLREMADDVTFWKLVADGINHHPQCMHHFAGDKRWGECLRCEVERLRSLALPPPVAEVVPSRSMAKRLTAQGQPAIAAQDAPPAGASAPAAPVGWQPIETAPKDGSAVLLYPSGCWAEDDDRGEVAYWVEDMGGWVTQGRRADDATEPTHWHPLPSSPAAAPLAPALPDPK